MSEAPDVERELRELMRSRVGTLPPPIETYETVRRRHRQSRRRAVLASAVAVAILVTGATGVRLALRPGPGGAVAQPAPAASGTRGSQAGDKELLEQARRYALDRVFRGSDHVDAPTVRVPYAEQRDGYVVVLVVGQRMKDNWYDAVFLGRQPGAAGSGFERVGGSSGNRQPGFDARGAQQYVDPLTFVDNVMFQSPAGVREFGVAVFPPGYRATIIRGGTVGADCRRDGSTEERLSLTAGTALFPLGPDDWPYLRITPNRGAAYLASVLHAHRLPPSEISDAERTAQIQATIRGTATDPQVREVSAYVSALPYSTGAVESPRRYLGVWAGRLPGNPGFAYLAGAQLRSGAVVLSGEYSNPGGAGEFGWGGGCVPAGQLDRTVLTARLTDLPGQPLLVIGPAAAARAEAVFGGGAVVPVPLTEGGGFLVRAGTVVEVRAYDRNGRLIGTAVPGRGLAGIPVQPR